jgi:hypothetical protein
LGAPPSRRALNVRLEYRWRAPAEQRDIGISVRVRCWGSHPSRVPEKSLFRLYRNIYADGTPLIGGRLVMATPRPTEARLLRQVVRDFKALLPSGWTLTTLTEPAGRGRPDLVAVVTGPDDAKTSLLVEAKRTLLPREADDAVRQMRSYAERAGLDEASFVVVAPYLSQTARERIAQAGASYIDSTGNMLVRTQRPALFIKQDGATKDPWPSDETLRTLKGRGAARALRALLDFEPPFGLRELAERAEVPLGTLSRTVDLLDRDGLITKGGRGPIVDLDWAGVIRRWAKDYDISTSNRVSTYLEPHGLTALSAKLGKLKVGYAITGAFAAQRFSPVTPARLAAIYVDDVVGWSERLDLRPTESGANVWLVEPYDDVVFDRTACRDGVVCVSPTQLAVDLLTGPGRDPSEGEELLAWMKGDDHAWRTR